MKTNQNTWLLSDRIGQGSYWFHLNPVSSETPNSSGYSNYQNQISLFLYPNGRAFGDVSITSIASDASITAFPRPTSTGRNNSTGSGNELNVEYDMAFRTNNLQNDSIFLKLGIIDENYRFVNILDSSISNIRINNITVGVGSLNPLFCPSVNEISVEYDLDSRKYAIVGYSDPRELTTTEFIHYNGINSIIAFSNRTTIELL